MIDRLTAPPRLVCHRCLRPESVCYCHTLSKFTTQTKVLFLQHPREHRKPIGTAHMAHLCLTNSLFRVGVEFDQDPVVNAALSDPARPAHLLFPGEGAVDVSSLPPQHPITLFVVDGTWWQAQKLVNANPRLRELPRLSFVPSQPSEYRIRREPEDHCVSTIEALFYVLSSLEGQGADFSALLRPFRAMVDSQLACIERLGPTRRAKHKLSRPRRNLFPPPGVGPENLVAVVAEANAWPLCLRDGPDFAPDELVHFAAARLDGSPHLDVIVAPRQKLAPRTVTHVELSAEQLRAGHDVPTLLRQAKAFFQPSDTICSWGSYAPSLFAATGGVFPKALLDLRTLTRSHVRGTRGTLEELTEKLLRAAPELPIPGRAGRRLAQLTALLRHFASTGISG